VIRTRRAYTAGVGLLVNAISASASEDFAGALTDYQPRLYSGSETLAKGQVQN